MQNNQSSKRFIPIGLMLFALFFGAGNLIFPASMGQAAGSNVWWALLGFCITGVGLPLLAVMCIGYSGKLALQQVASRIHPYYAVFYTVVCYMAIGPCFAVPRTGTVSYEIAIRPFLSDESAEYALPIFLAFFFLPRDMTIVSLVGTNDLMPDSFSRDCVLSSALYNARITYHRFF